MLTVEIARATWSYDPETGVLRWKVKPAHNKSEIGDTAGHRFDLKNTSYICVGLSYRSYLAHRVAWLITYGVWPIGEIDHENGIGTDNRIENLVEKNRFGNQQNRRLNKTNKSGFCGVYWRKDRSKWVVQIQVNSRKMCLGYFAGIDEAIAVRQAANVQHGFHPLHGTKKES